MRKELSDEFEFISDTSSLIQKVKGGNLFIAYSDSVDNCSKEESFLVSDSGIKIFPQRDGLNLYGCIPSGGDIIAQDID